MEARGTGLTELGSRGRRQALPRIALGILLLVAGAQATVPRLTISGEVRDAHTGDPLAGAVARVGDEIFRANPSGSVQLGLVPPWQTISFEADGYEPRTTTSWPPGPTSVALPPLTAEIRVVDHESGRLLPATVVADGARLQPLGLGRFLLAPVRAGLRLTAEADGFEPISADYAGGSGVEMRLAPSRIGRVVDATTGKPIAGARIVADGQVLTSSEDGRFELTERPRRPMRVLAPGYRRLEIAPGASRPLDLRLEPFAVKGLYLTLYGVADESLRSNALRLLETTEANALVVDVKGDRGLLAYESRVPLAQKIGANASPTLPNVDRFLGDLRRRGVYSIARIVVMKDDLLARNGAAAGLDVAIKDRKSGQVWVDGEGLGWVDPFRPEVRDYNMALAVEAAERGFDEVQFDYIRFPTDASSTTSVDAAVYSRELTEQNRVEAIAGVLAQTHQALRPLGAFLSIDTFGYACWRDDDLGIGQHLPSLAAHVDYISPMVYPSTYNAGIPGKASYPEVVGRPYDVIHDSLEQARGRVEGRGALLRPWLQYFDDYPWATKRQYNAAEIQAQKKATADAGGVGWMMWDPFNRYNRGGFDPR